MKGLMYSPLGNKKIEVCSVKLGETLGFKINGLGNSIRSEKPSYHILASYYTKSRSEILWWGRGWRVVGETNSIVRYKCGPR